MKRSELLIENGDFAGKRYAVPTGGLRLGRSSSNDVHIPDEELSRNHCLFEQSGEADIKVTDLASANGTEVNGRNIGSESVVLKPGDRLVVGSVGIVVIGEDGVPVKKPAEEPAEKPAAVAPKGPVDLGFGSAKKGAAEPATAGAGEGAKKRRSPLMNIILGFAVLACGGGIFLILNEPASEGGDSTPAAIVEADTAEALCELEYEKLDGDSEKVFRYSMTLAPGGKLTVSLDDVPGENRHLTKTAQLGESALGQLAEILSSPEFAALDPEYTGPESEPPVLRSRTLRAVWTRHEQRFSCVNAVEPDAFRRVRERLEAFSKNELGIWAMGHSRAQLIELAAGCAETAKQKWEDREVDHGNLHASVHCWKEALFYLETVNPKPEVFDDYAKGLRTASEELDRRYKDRRFAADRAINIADWENAKKELQVLLDLVPDRDDERYREASAKLMDVEKRMQKGAK